MTPGPSNADNGKLTHWLFRIRVEDQPGIMAAIAATFSRRGIQVENFNGTGAPITLSNEAAQGEIRVGFKAYDYRMNSLQRVIARLQQVKQIEVFNLDAAPRVLKTATVQTRGTADEVTSILSEAHPDVGFLLGEGPSCVVILHGSVAAVDHALALLQNQQQVRSCDYSLTPVSDSPA